jgi:hypothetical protein
VSARAADEPVPGLQDLLGSTTAALDAAMAKRGYAFQGLGHGVRSDFRYWSDPSKGDCVGVKLAADRAAAIWFSPTAQCAQAAKNKPAAPAGPAAPPPSATGFATVCGSLVKGTEVRQNCTVEGVAPGTVGGETVLFFPEDRATLRWTGPNRANVTFMGKKAQDTVVGTSGGITRFFSEGHSYFYFSDRAAAAEQVKALK